MHNNHTTVRIKQQVLQLQEAGALLHLTLPEIKEKYKDHYFCVIHYFDKGKEDVSIEIQFEDATVVSCLFNKRSICYSVFMSLKNEKIMQQLIRYMKENYTYDVQGKKWRVSNFYVKTLPQPDAVLGCCLSINCF